MDEFTAAAVEERPLEVEDRRRVPEVPSLAVPLGEAPDGLPLVLRIDCHTGVGHQFMHALGIHSRAELPETVAQALDRLEDAVTGYARTRGVVNEGPDSTAAQSYVSAGKIGAILGPSLLARALGSQSPLVLPEDLDSHTSQPERVADTRALVRTDDPEGAVRRVSGRRRLGLPCGDGAPWIVEHDPAIRWTRPFRFESISSQDEATYRTKEKGRILEGTLTDRTRYLEAVRGAEAVAWALPRCALAEAIAQLAERLGELHGKGIVHGDVKPQNALLLSEGASPFDSLDIPAGSPSPAATPGWAAPEQVLGRPVAPATDVYALGLMTASLVGAAIFGEERTYVIPTGGSARQRLRLLVSSDVFIDSGIVPATGRNAWREFLSRAIAFEADDRFPTGQAFAAALRELCHDHAPNGLAPIGGGPGVLVRNVIHEGETGPAWVVTDHR